MKKSKITLFDEKTKNPDYLGFYVVEYGMIVERIRDNGINWRHWFGIEC